MSALLSYLLDPPEVGAQQWGFRLSHAIDLMKGLTPVAILVCMHWYSEAPTRAWDNPACWVYFGIHGCYGLLWVGKGVAGFGDLRWQARKPLWYLPVIVSGLALYWLPIWLLCQQQTPHDTPPWLYGVAVMLFGLGVFWHYCSDMHKTLFLEYRPLLQKAGGGKSVNILQTKLWTYLRNPNYFGELLIYASFCILPRHPLPWLWLGVMVGVYWVFSMLRKEKSLARFGTEFEAYRKRSYMFLPFLW